MRGFLLLFAAALILSACTSASRPGEEKIPPREAFKLALRQNSLVKTLSGECRVSVESPDEAQSFNAKIYYKEPDSLMMVVDYLFGADAAYLAVIGGRYLFYNKINDNFLSGKVTDSFTRAFFQLPVPLSELSRLLVASVDMDSSLAGSEPAFLDEGYLFEKKRGDLDYFYLIDPYYARISRVEIYDRDKRLLLSEEFSEFEKSGTIFFPREIILKRPGKKQYISLYYTKIDLNKNLSGDLFRVTVPPSTKQLDLDTQ